MSYDDWKKAWSAEAIPEMEFGRWTVDKFTITENSLENLRLAVRENRAARPGTYTRLSRGHTLVMSDTTAEFRDHLRLFWNTGEIGGRVLIAGLGLGCALRAVLTNPGIEHVDVVELDEGVVENIGKLHDDPRVEFHVGSIFDKKWPKGSHWSAAWFDIWDDINPDNLGEMGKLARSYTRRVDWYGCWSKEQCQQAARSGRIWG